MKTRMIIIQMAMAALLLGGIIWISTTVDSIYWHEFSELEDKGKMFVTISLVTGGIMIFLGSAGSLLNLSYCLFKKHLRLIKSEELLIQE